MLVPSLSRIISSLRPLSSLSSVTRHDRILTVKWDDGCTGDFPLVWMRDSSPDALTYSLSPAMSARNLHMNSFDVEVEPLSFSISPQDNELHIEWPGKVTSKFSSEWLQLRNPSSESAAERRRKWYLFPSETWGKEEIEKRLGRFNYNDVISDDKTLHDFLEKVCLDGIAVITNGPKGEKGAVEKIGERIGFIQRTHFGNVFQVCTKQNASNMAYALPSTLPFHTDFPSLSDPPQLQMLHMYIKAKEGGKSLFVDGFHVANQLRLERPDIFSILSTMTCEFIEEGYDIHDGPNGETINFPFNMAARHTTIKVDESGRIVRVQFGNAMRSWFYDCDPNKIQELYRALKVFTHYVYQERNLLKITLQEGDTVLWANTRLLHTRDGYVEDGERRRTLTGCYFAWDIVKSRVRQLSRKLSLPSSQPSAVGK
ncbi:hypothetical protein PENTCL1PPCAC_6824 [Pristionchus entomophagus]|uniref:TauD/TfdA-like domain-containing protein n=1 Tax=Pristionchus entomophagus TaxID=358040 RepID=A0AAV5SP07_9BILA|nr:hypothetical protein PENTCL1PPCAC_6824 [Pristionchus entomophagus]